MTKLTAEMKYRMLLALSQEISRSLELDDVLKHLIEYVRTAVSYDAAGIFVLNRNVPLLAHPGTRVIAGMCTFGFDADPNPDDPMIYSGKGIIGHVIRTGETVIAADVSADPRYVEGRPETRSEIAVPISSNGVIIGALNLECDELCSFSADDAEVLEFFATAAALAIEKALLHRQALERQHLQHQLDVAHHVQACLLPESDPVVDGYDIAGISLPCWQIGGDYFDYIPLDDGRLALVIADVSGKGTPAALIMATIRAALHAELRRVHDVPTVLRDVNRVLRRSVETSRFVTALFGLFDPQNGTFTYLNCGHNPALVLRADGGRSVLNSMVSALGLVRGPLPEAIQVSLGAGDMLVLYTDGVVDTMNAADEDFGLERLEAAIRTHAALPSSEIIDRIVAATQAFAGREAYDDDFTVMVVRRNSATRDARATDQVTERRG